MIKLHIDGKQAVLKEGTSIALTMENPFYTQSGEYTYEVELPLRGCVENRRIFGTIHSPWATLSDLARKQYTFRLKTELFELEGKAVVTAVTHEAVKVQLLSGNSALNFDSLAEVGEKYIDELELGSAYDTEWAKHHPGKKQTLQQTLNLLLSKDYKENQRENLLHGTLKQTECVCFPIYSRTDQGWANEHTYNSFYTYLEDGEGQMVWSETTSYHYLIGDHSQTRPNTTLAGTTAPTDFFWYAPQPYLAVIVERILAALGYTLHPEDNIMREIWTKDIFVANARSAFHYADCLPHWSVKEFFNELRATYGLIIIVKNNHCRIVTRAQYYGADYLSIENPTDERTTNIEASEAQQDTTSGNIAYEESDARDPWLNIPEEAYEKMDVRHVATKSDIHLEKLTTEEKRASNILFIADDTKKRYGIFTHEEEFYLTEVDQMGPLFRDDDYEIDQRLRIVPCPMAANIPTTLRIYEFAGWDYENNQILFSCTEERPTDPHAEEGEGAGGFYVPFLVTADTRNESTIAPYNLQKAVEHHEESTTEGEDGEQNEDTTQDKAAKQDIMEVALRTNQAHVKRYYADINNHPDKVKSAVIPYPVGIPYHRNRLDGQLPTNEMVDLKIDHFCLADNASSMVSALTPTNIEIDTRVVKTITYLDNHVDPTRLYLINGKRYVCQKIELRLEEDRVNPLKTGYFYEIS